MADEEILKEPAETAEAKPATGKELEALRARLAAVEAEKAKLRDKEAKRKQQEAATQKEKETAEALKRGEHEKLIAELQEKLKATESEIGSYRKAAEERLNKKIEALPEAARAELELVRDVLPHDKLEKLVELKSAPQAQTEEMKSDDDYTPAMPAPSTSAGGPRREKDPLHPGTVHILKALMAPESVFEMGRQATSFLSDRQTGDHKFRWSGTGDDGEDTRRFIRFVAAGAADPWAARREAHLKKLKELKKAF